jgi:hypothetical protein
LAVVGVGLVLAIAAAAVAGGTDQPPTSKASAQPPAAAPASPTSEAEPEDEAPADDSWAEEAVYDTPVPADFKMALRETSREHFGSAGDLVEYKLELTQVRDRTYNPDQEYDLKYQVTGDEDGPKTDTITVRGDEYEVPSEDMVSTYTNGKVRVKILSITEA